MKLLSLFICMIGLSTPVEWSTDFAQAKNEATQSNKWILLNFSGSDWCAPCINLKKNVFENETFIQYASENLVLVRADFPRLKKNQLDKAQIQRNEALAETYNQKGKFPLTVLLRPNGSIVREWEGYQTSVTQFVKELQFEMNK